MAWVTIAVEILTGVALLLGAFIPLVSIPAIVLLVVAIITVHLPNGFSSIKLLSYANGRAQFGPPGYECDLLYIACIVALALMGPSPLSVEGCCDIKMRSRIKPIGAFVLNNFSGGDDCGTVGLSYSMQQRASPLPPADS
jgi:hypothetical protein